MSEIKFACPHCARHIASSSDYADMCIVCPGCSKPMLVPILSAMDAAHPGLCLVAATPAPRQRFRSRIPALDPWTEEEWERHAAETPDSGFGQFLPWLVPFLVLVPLLAVLVATTNGLRGGFVTPLGVVLGIICSSLAAWLAVRNLQRSELTRRITGMVVMLGLMGIQLSVLGVAGCCASID